MSSNRTRKVYPLPRRDFRETGEPSATSFPGAARTAILSARRSASSRNYKQCNRNVVMAIDNRQEKNLHVL